MPALLNICLFGLYAPVAYALSGALGVVGLALALSVVNAVFALLCLAAMRWEIGQIGGRRLLRSLTRILIAGAVMYAVAWGGVMLLGNGGTGLLDRALILTGVGGTSLLVYLGVAYLLGAEELKSVVALIRKRV
jgi:peptidoglycan biosynthesis protein MviN/MurJ (putative lipid II flippase)